MAMPHDLNQLNSYDHLMGTPHKSHEGSQSKGHLAGGDAGWKNAGSAGPASKKGSQPESKGPGGMDM